MISVFNITDDINRELKDGFYFEGVIQSTNYPIGGPPTEYNDPKDGYIRHLPDKVPVTFSLLSDPSVFTNRSTSVELWEVQGRRSPGFLSGQLSSISLIPVDFRGKGIEQRADLDGYTIFLIKYKGRL